MLVLPVFVQFLKVAKGTIRQTFSSRSQKTFKAAALQNAEKVNLYRDYAGKTYRHLNNQS